MTTVHNLNILVLFRNSGFRSSEDKNLSVVWYTAMSLCK